MTVRSGRGNKINCMAIIESHTGHNQSALRILRILKMKIFVESNKTSY